MRGFAPHSPVIRSQSANVLIKGHGYSMPIVFPIKSDRLPSGAPMCSGYRQQAYSRNPTPCPLKAVRRGLCSCECNPSYCKAVTVCGCRLRKSTHNRSEPCRLVPLPEHTITNWGGMSTPTNYSLFLVILGGKMNDPGG